VLVAHRPTRAPWHYRAAAACDLLADGAMNEWWPIFIVWSFTPRRAACDAEQIPALHTVKRKQWPRLFNCAAAVLRPWRLRTRVGPYAGGAVNDNLKFGLLVLAGLVGVIYVESNAMNMTMIDTVRQLGADLLHRFFY
jgi:hypothetical protein